MSESAFPKIVNAEKEITLGGKKFIVKSPTISDIADTNEYISHKKKEKRKETFIERTQIMKELPPDMPYEEKIKFISEIYPLPMSAEQKMKILESFPKEMSEKEKQKQLLIILNERDGLEFEETLYLLWKILKKSQKEMTFQEVKEIVSLNDLTEVYRAISMEDEETAAKNDK